MTDQLLLVLLGAAIAALGYLFKRRIERKPELEELERQERILRLRQALAKQHEPRDVSPTLRELSTATLESQRGSHLAGLPPDLEKRLQDATTQYDMNMVAGEAVERAMQQVEALEQEILSSLWETRIPHFTKSMEIWREYARAQADFAGSEFDGGTLSPLVAGLELYRLYDQRFGDLESWWQQERALER